MHSVYNACGIVFIYISRFRDSGYTILVEKSNKQGKINHSDPQHHAPIPKLLHAHSFFSLDTQNKTKTIV